VGVQRILTLSIVAIFLTVFPFLSLSKTVISEDELNGIMAEAGVTLNFGTGAYTNATMMVTNWSPSLVSFGDANGFTGYASAGWIGVSGVTMDASSNILIYNSLTVDVGTSASVTKLNLGLPSLMIHPVSTDATLKLGTSQTLSDAQPALCTLYNDKFAILVNPAGTGNLTISRHTSAQGLEVAMSGVSLGIPNEAIDISIGDSNGFTGYTSAGYFGVRDLLASNTLFISFSDLLSIDVGSSASVTAVKVVLPTTVINPTQVNVTAPLVLSTAKTLTGTQELGSLNLNGFTTTLSGQMQIMPH